MNYAELARELHYDTERIKEVLRLGRERSLELLEKNKHYMSGDNYLKHSTLLNAICNYNIGVNDVGTLVIYNDEQRRILLKGKETKEVTLEDLVGEQIKKNRLTEFDESEFNSTYTGPPIHQARREPMRDFGEAFPQLRDIGPGDIAARPVYEVRGDVAIEQEAPPEPLPAPPPIFNIETMQRAMQMLERFEPVEQPETPRVRSARAILELAAYAQRPTIRG